MNSITEIEIGAAYWWQPKPRSTADIIKVVSINKKSRTLVKCKNISPDRAFTVSIRCADGSVVIHEQDTPKGSKIGTNRQRGDIYENVHISQLSKTIPINSKL